MSATDGAHGCYFQQCHKSAAAAPCHVRVLYHHQAWTGCGAEAPLHVLSSHLLQGSILCVMCLDTHPGPVSLSPHALPPKPAATSPQRWAVSLDMAAARLNSSSSTLKRQAAEAGGRAAELEAQAASLSARQQELEGLSRELNKDRGLLEQLAGQLEVGRGQAVESKHNSMLCRMIRSYCASTYSSN